MAKKIAYPKLPRAPRRTVPGAGQVAQIKDPSLRTLLRIMQDRQQAFDQQLKTLDTYALKAGSPVQAYGQRVINVGTPVHRDDAVPLWYLQQFVSTQAQLVARRASNESGGEESNEFGIIGGGSDPPLVALPDLYGAVQAYADANPVDFANHCVTSGGSWAFMTGLIANLQGIDVRVGGNGKRGDSADPSLDALSYYHGVLPPVSGSKNVYVIDVIAKSCSAEAGPAWQNVTTSKAAGAWLATVP